MTRHIKRGGRIWIRIFPGQADFAEAGRSAHGQRQGQPGVLRRRDRPGKVLYEMDGVDEALAREAFALAAAKLPIRTAFVHRLLG